MKYAHHLSSSLILAALVSLGCGGSKPPVETMPTGQSSGQNSDQQNGQKTGQPGNQTAGVAGDLDVPDVPDDKGDTGTVAKTGGAGSVGGPVTFRLKNSAADDELSFSLDKGWQPVIFAFSGKPPNAKAIVMFPKACTASCSLGAKERCPTCETPDKVKDIKAAEQREVVAPGKTLDVPWDGQVHVYEKKKCECYRRQAVPPETYTVRACGLRITKSAKKSTKYQCVESTMTFPANGPQVVELDFPKP